MIRLMFALLMVGGGWCSPVLAAEVPCANMLTESGNVGDPLQVGIKLCDADDAPVPSPSGENVVIQVYWYHPESPGTALGSYKLDMGLYSSGMKWSDLATVCRQDGRCDSFIANHVQEKPGQVCAQLVVGGESSNKSPGPPGCVVVGNECSWEASSYQVDFGTVNSSDVNGLTKDTSVNIQCGFVTDVSFSIASDELVLSGPGTGEIRASFSLDGAPLSGAPLTLTERQGNNLHTLKTTLKSSGVLSGGTFSAPLIIVAGYD